MARGLAGGPMGMAFGGALAGSRTTFGTAAVGVGAAAVGLGAAAVGLQAAVCPMDRDGWGRRAAGLLEAFMSCFLTACLRALLWTRPGGSSPERSAGGGLSGNPSTS